ncbi:ArsR/SmtB family transcription factor [Thalassiella azotivora]
MSEERCDLLCLDLPRAEAVRSMLPAAAEAEQVARLAGAFADPTRLRLAAALAAGGEMCVCDLAWVSGLADNLVSHHVRRLRTAGLASRRREGKLVMYRLTDTGQVLLAMLTEHAGHGDNGGGVDGPPKAASAGQITSAGRRRR